jgi:hypothetical protein
VTPTRRAAALSALAVSSLLVAACGSSGEDGKSADQIVADAKAALKSATSFHLVGNVTDSSGGGTVKFDMKVDDKNTASGHMEQGGVGFGKDLFAKFSAAAADAIGDQWVTVTGNASLESAASSVTGLSDASALADSLGSSGGPYSKSGTKTVNGQSVVAVNSKDGEMDVADSGTPYPVHFDGGSKGTMDITEYGSHFGIKAPSGALDVSALGGAASSDSSSSSASGSSKAVVDAGQVRDGVLLVAQGTITTSSGSVDDAWGAGPAVQKQLPSDISVAVQTGSTSGQPAATPNRVVLYAAETSSGNLFMVVVRDTSGTCDIGSLSGNPANGNPVKKTLSSGIDCTAESGLNALNS